MMGDFERFIVDNEDSDIARLLFSNRNWPVPDDPVLSGLDARDLAVSTIESRNKLSKKVPEWYSETSLVYPNTLSAEQCSSSATALYKADLALRIAGEKGRVADLTGGLGVDSWAFAQKVGSVLYNDSNVSLALAATHNFRCLGLSNVSVGSAEVTPSSVSGIVQDFHPDLIYLDPARRSKDGRKVFMLEDCSPDVVGLLPDLFLNCRNVLLKLSPMADISLVSEKLNRSYEAGLEASGKDGWNGNWVREIHVIAIGGECKELLVWMDREWKGACSLTCCEDGDILSFSESETTGSKPVLPESVDAGILFEPGKSLTKAGVFNAVCGKFGMVKLARSTHLYTFKDVMTREETLSRLESLRPFGKIYDVVEILPMNKASFKEVKKNYPRSEVSARNIPLASDELRSRLGVSSGEDAHIFGARIETPFQNGNFLIVCRRI